MCENNPAAVHASVCVKSLSKRDEVVVRKAGIFSTADEDCAKQSTDIFDILGSASEELVAVLQEGHKGTRYKRFLSRNTENHYI